MNNANSYPSSLQGDLPPHHPLRDVMNVHIDEMIQMLIKVLEVGEPYVVGFCRPFWLSHLFLLRAELKRHVARPRGLSDYERLRQGLLSLAHEFMCIRRLVNSKLIPSTPELAKAMRKASRNFEALLAAIYDVQQLEQTQEQLFSWGASLVAAVTLLGEIFSSTSMYALRIWPEELDGRSIGLVKRDNFPQLTVGEVRRTVRNRQVPRKLDLNGGITKETH